MGRRGGGGLLYSMSHVAWGGLGRRGGTLGGFIARWEVIFPLAESPFGGPIGSWGAAPGGPRVPAYPPPHRVLVRRLCAQATKGAHDRCRGLPGRENRGRHSRLKLLTGELSGPVTGQGPISPPMVVLGSFGAAWGALGHQPVATREHFRFCVQTERNRFRYCRRMINRRPGSALRPHFERIVSKVPTKFGLSSL